MKKLVLASSALMLTLATAVSVPTVASAQKTSELDMQEIQAACTTATSTQEAMQEGFTMAACMDLAESGNAAEICRFLRDRDLLASNTFGVRGNMGGCVSNLRQYQNESRKN
jgi:hypothetical protein